MRISIGQRIGAIIVGAVLAIGSVWAASLYERQAVAALEARMQAAGALQVAVAGLDRRFILLQQSFDRLVSGNDASLAGVCRATGAPSKPISRACASRCSSRRSPAGSTSWQPWPRRSAPSTAA